MTTFLLLLAAVAAEPANLVKNPGFEAGAAPWSLPRTYTVDTTVAHSGQASLRVDNPDAGQYLLANQPLRIEPGMMFDLSVWVRTEGVEGGDSGATICMEWYAGDKYLGGSYPAGIKGTQDWTLVKGTSSAVPAETTRLSVTLYLRRGMTGRAWFDDVRVSLRYPPAMTARLLQPPYRGRTAAGVDAKAVAEVRLGSPLPERLPAEQTDLRWTLAAAGGQALASGVVAPHATDLTRVEVPLAGVSAGRHRLELQLVPKAGGEPLSAIGFPIEVLARGAPQPRVWIDERGRTMVDGRPYFPLGLYDGLSAPEDLQRIGEAGFNCIMPYGLAGAGLEKARGYLDAAQASGLRVLFTLKDLYDGTQWRPAKVGEWTAVDDIARGLVTTFRDHPAVLAWYLNDELPTSFHETLAERYRQVVEWDPDHPAWIVLYQVGDLQYYTDTTDILGTDPYPIGRRPLSLAGDWTTRTVAAGGPGRATWQVPQIFDWGVYAKSEQDKAESRAPSLAEMRNMTFQCLAAGATGLIYYSYFDLKKDKLGFDTRWADVRQLAAEVNALVPFLLSDERAPELGLSVSDPANVYARAWRHGGETLVLAANGSDDTTGTVTLKLPGTPTVRFGAAQRVAAGGLTLAPGEAVAVVVR